MGQLPLVRLSSCPMQDSQDVQYMIEALGVLGVKLEQDRPARKLVVHGCNGRFTSQGAELYLGNAGTAMRYAHVLDFYALLTYTPESCSCCSMPRQFGRPQMRPSALALSAGWQGMCAWA